MIAISGSVLENHHQPIVSKEEFEKDQSLQMRHSRIGSQEQMDVSMRQKHENLKRTYQSEISDCKKNRNSSIDNTDRITRSTMKVNLIKNSFRRPEDRSN